MLDVSEAVRKMTAAGTEVLKPHKRKPPNTPRVVGSTKVGNDDGGAAHPGEVDSTWSWMSAVQPLDSMSINLAEGGGKRWPTGILVHWDGSVLRSNSAGTACKHIPDTTLQNVWTDVLFA